MRWRWFVNATVHLRFADCCEQQSDSFHQMGLFPMATALLLGETDAPPHRNPVASLLHHQQPTADASLSATSLPGGGGGEMGSLVDDHSAMEGDSVGANALDGGAVVFLSNSPRDYSAEGASVGGQAEEQEEEEATRRMRLRAARPGDRPTRRATLVGSVIGVYRSSTQEGMITLTHCLGDHISDVTQVGR